MTKFNSGQGRETEVEDFWLFVGCTSCSLTVMHTDCPLHSFLSSFGWWYLFEWAEYVNDCSSWSYEKFVNVLCIFYWLCLCSFHLGRRLLPIFVLPRGGVWAFCMMVPILWLLGCLFCCLVKRSVIIVGSNL
jgi:hypothetical protein